MNVNELNDWINECVRRYWQKRLESLMKRVGGGL